MPGARSALAPGAAPSPPPARGWAPHRAGSMSVPSESSVLGRGPVPPRSCPPPSPPAAPDRGPPAAARWRATARGGAAQRPRRMPGRYWGVAGGGKRSAVTQGAYSRHPSKKIGGQERFPSRPPHDHTRQNHRDEALALLGQVQFVDQGFQPITRLLALGLCQPPGQGLAQRCLGRLPLVGPGVQPQQLVAQDFPLLGR